MLNKYNGFIYWDPNVAIHPLTLKKKKIDRMRIDSCFATTLALVPVTEWGRRWGYGLVCKILPVSRGNKK